MNTKQGITQNEKNILVNAKSDEGKAKLVSARYKGQFAYNEAFGLMFYNSKYWIFGHDAETKLSEAIGETFVYLQHLAELSNWPSESIDKFATNHSKKSACKAEFINLGEISADVDSFNQYNDLLPVENGVIDLKTGELLPHDAKYRFTFVCPIFYNPNANQERIQKFFSDSVEHYNDDAEVRKFVQVSLGYLLTGDISQEIYFYIWGKARSGKGTLAEMIQTIMGNVAGGATFDSFTRKRVNDQGFDLAPLHNKRVIFASESDENSRMNEAFIKSATGGDTMTASFKGKDQFTFKPKWKLVFMSNHEIAASPDDTAFWIRTRLLNFPNGHDEETMDIGYKASLLQKENLEAMLAYMVQGAMTYYSERKIKQPAILKALKQERILQLDTIQQWLDERTVVSTLDNGDGANKLFTDYENWCNINGYDAKEVVSLLKQFTRSLRTKGYKSERITAGVVFNLKLK